MTTKAEIPMSSVSITTSNYQFSHDKRPAGSGNWVFCPEDKYHANDWIDFAFFAPRGLPYLKAKRAARAHFAKAGERRVVVCS